MAAHNNIESGFLVNLYSPQKMLEPLDEKPLEFKPLEEEEGAILDKELIATPKINLTFDWRVMELACMADIKAEFLIDLSDASGEVVATIDSRIGISIKPDELLIKVLKNSSFINVSGIIIDDESEIPQHIVMVQQIGWTHKPIELPSLTAQQILAIYAGMPAEQRQQLLDREIIKRLVKLGEVGELTVDDDDDRREQFFCEYAEIFHAFKLLNKKLTLARKDGQIDLVNYYLTGTGIDSIPSLIDAVFDRTKDGYNPIVSYLLSLSAKEILKQNQYKNVPQIKNIKDDLNQKIRGLKSSGEIILDGNSNSDRKRFFEWFETQFFSDMHTKTEVIC